jgi:UDP-N-acetylmuramoylalanine--D-glutamate ligase
VAAHKPRSIAIADQATTLPLSQAELALISHQHLGASWLEALANYDILIRSPGVPLHVLKGKLSLHSAPYITSGTNIFLEARARKSIGITGTKGKSTTTSLLYHILDNAGLNACLGGNIGIAPVSLLHTPADLYVLELSSYQLEDCHYSPHGAVLLNLYPEHLDHHGDFAAYGAAKAQITLHQGADDFLVTPDCFPLLQELTASSPAQCLSFGSPESQAWIEDDTYYARSMRGDVRKLCGIHSTRLKGPGNQHNILAALTAASRYPISDEVLKDTLMTFKPLPHRLEEVGCIGGVTYVNDSISTVPQATINALETFGPQVKTLILGGYDRGVPFESLATYLASSSVETLLLFPPSGSRIRAAAESALETQNRAMRIIAVTSMEEAVERAFEVTPTGAVCLLSPASPSFPLFKNFEERGERFKALVTNRLQPSL